MSDEIIEPVMPRPKHVDGKTVSIPLDLFEAKRGDVAKEILKVMTPHRALDMTADGGRGR